MKDLSRYRYRSPRNGALVSPGKQARGPVLQAVCPHGLDVSGRIVITVRLYNLTCLSSQRGRVDISALGGIRVLRPSTNSPPRKVCSQLPNMAVYQKSLYTRQIRAVLSLVSTLSLANAGIYQGRETTHSRAHVCVAKDSCNVSLMLRRCFIGGGYLAFLGYMLQGTIGAQATWLIQSEHVTVRSVWAEGYGDQIRASLSD